MNKPFMDLVWLACDCYVWPCSPMAHANRCGWCLMAPRLPVPAPADGKARPL